MSAAQVVSGNPCCLFWRETGSRTGSPNGEFFVRRALRGGGSVSRCVEAVSDAFEPSVGSELRFLRIFDHGRTRRW